MPTANESYPPLLSLAVHEFRTPASVIGGYLRMLQRDIDAPLTDRQRKMIEEAENSCTRLVALFSELSDISKLDAGIVALSLKPVDAFSLLAEVAERVHEPEDRGVHLKVQGLETGARMPGDATRLRSAFGAVCQALLREKAGPCTLVADRRVETRDGRACAVIVVAAEASVQDAYDRPAGPFDEHRGGLGLTLPLARRVIEGHGGRLWSPAAAADNDPLTRGSAIISLPITE